MRNKYILSVGILVFLLIGNASLTAQTLRVLRDRGPMFITSISFLQGVHRFPYGVVLGEETELKNRKKTKRNDTPGN